MAERQEDRDGLKLDTLHLPLGPVLWGWPPGLTIQVRLQGDIIQDASLDLESFRPARSWWNEPWHYVLEGKVPTRCTLERLRAVSHLDSLIRLLNVAGDPGSSLLATRLRDHLLAGARAAPLLTGLRFLKNRITTARLLDRITDGIGVISLDEAREFHLSGPALRACGEVQDLRAQDDAYPDFETIIALGAGDVRSRWRQWFAEIESALQLLRSNPGPSPWPIDGLLEAPRGLLGHEVRPSKALLHCLPALIEGEELAVARLIVASLDPDMDELKR